MDPCANEWRGYKMWRKEGEIVIFSPVRHFASVLILLTSCSVPNPKIIGRYATKEFSLFERVFSKKRIIGVELNLSKDSTYCYQTCSTVQLGKWSVKDDSLILFTDSGYFLNSLKPVVKWRDAYKINDNELRRVVFGFGPDSTKIAFKDWLAKVQ